MPPYSFIILTFNEEIHLPRLLDSIRELVAPVYILDSGSTDNTLKIAEQFKAQVKVNKFENHPKQWDFALKNFDVKTPWIIGLDADQIVTPELFNLLKNFKDEDYKNINAIYFNRKNFFQGTWIKHGGYYPFYMLKMFRTGIGFSDLNENMDHRFVAPGKSLIWKDGYLLEENLKENDTEFWIAKHRKYSKLIAEEEYERLYSNRSQTVDPLFFGTPDQRRAWFKRLWWNLPLGLRPYLYFSYRLIFKLGILDGKTGIFFHYLHALWFRKLVDKELKTLINIRK
ncbi:glycosyltransferase family 2 protein [Pedobacter namyangjuensis]|uniref:glycosyltransferase family 2 protein n=1 Tax=Pedobacter namyangjuensis TaxID=600626 RepID=UPI001F054C42|nr:glycosyltransferase family 2 protein [Pedobacter namyangjuensis]